MVLCSGSTDVILLVDAAVGARRDLALVAGFFNSDLNFAQDLKDPFLDDAAIDVEHMGAHSVEFGQNSI